jgi:PAS domain S-box-containing protein
MLTGRALREQVMGFRDAEGETRWISINTQPIGTAGRQPEYAVSTFVDITKRKRAEQQRRSVLESMSDGFLAIDEQWRFVHVNPAAERMLGVQRENLLGQNQWDLYPATIGSPVEKAYRDAAAGYPSVFENFYEPWQRWFSCRCFPREGGGIVVFFNDVTEARESQEALRRSHDELRSLVGQMNALEARERSRIARELHDELQQSLAAARLEITTVRRALGEESPALREIAASAARNLDLVIESTRRIVGDLRPPVLDALGLGPALETLAERLRALTGIVVVASTVDPFGAAAGLPEELTYCLYRIAQEALNNVQKHAGAARVDIRLDLGTPGSAELSVCDDGRGLRAVDLRKVGSYGVLGMRERLHALGGELIVAGMPTGGTVVRARVPLRTD